MKISDIVDNIVKDYISKSVEIVEDKYKFNQYNTIRRIYLYINNQFWNAVPEDTIFWNISNQRIPHFAKNIDLDTKNLEPIGMGSLNMVQAFVLREKFRKWMRESDIAIQLNDIAESLATFGSTVVKRKKENGRTKLEECDLRNLYFDPKVSCIRNANIVEMHYMNETDIREKSEVWNNIEKVLDRGEQEDDPKKETIGSYKIWEYWGEVENKGKMEYRHVIGSGSGDKEVIMFDEKKKKEECPYYDFHIGKFRGRWLRAGVVERLFKLQEQANAVVNQNAEARTIASLLLMQSENSETEGNVLKSAESGDIINDGALQQIPIDNRAFTVLLQELQQIEVKADKLCMTPDVVTGEELPSGTTFRGQAQLTNAARSTFRDTQQRLGSRLEEVLRTEILPEIRKEFQGEDVIEIAHHEADIRQFDQMMKNRRMKKFIQEVQDGVRNIESREELQEALQRIEDNVEEENEERGRQMRVPKNFINFTWDIRFNITGESQDREQTNNAYYNALQMTMSNPQILNTPLMKQYLENNGISWWRLRPSQRRQMERAAQQQQGGLPERQQPDKLSSMVNSQQ